MKKGVVGRSKGGRVCKGSRRPHGEAVTANGHSHGDGDGDGDWGMGRATSDAGKDVQAMSLRQLGHGRGLRQARSEERIRPGKDEPRREKIKEA
eukprot:348285-Hanusia_phi.AAC.3